MNTWKRRTALLLALCLALGLTACTVSGEDIAAVGQAVTEVLEAMETDAPEKSAAETEDLVLVDEPAEEEAPAGETAEEETPAEAAPAEEPEAPIDRDGWYTTKEDVALYLHTYGELPENFITKNEARALGWNGGGLDGYADGKSIGGDRFGNYEGILPDGSYHECDIDTMHASGRGAKRLVYADDGRIYYTEDHYESFELLYGEE